MQWLRSSPFHSEMALGSPSGKHIWRPAWLVSARRLENREMIQGYYVTLLRIILDSFDDKKRLYLRWSEELLKRRAAYQRLPLSDIANFPESKVGRTCKQIRHMFPFLQSYRLPNVEIKSQSLLSQ